MTPMGKSLTALVRPLPLSSSRRYSERDSAKRSTKGLLPGFRLSPDCCPPDHRQDWTRAFQSI